MRRRLVVLMLVAACGQVVNAEDDGQVVTGRRATVSVTARQPTRVFALLAEMADLGMSIDPALTKPVTITLEDVTLRTLLDAICDSIGCRWRIDGHTLIVEALPFDPSRGKTWPSLKEPAMPPGSQFNKASVAAILDAISRAVGEGATYEVPELAAGQLVTVDVSNQDALRAIAKMVKAAGRASGSQYTVTIRRPGERPTIIKTVVPGALPPVRR